MSTHHKAAKDENVLTSVAESIGSALGTIAANASAVSSALARNDLSKAAEREGKKLVRKSKTLARKIHKTASKSLKRNAGSARKALQTSRVKRTRPVTTKKRRKRL